MRLSEPASQWESRNVIQNVNVRLRLNSTSSVFATETVSHPDVLKTLYYISYIWQADLFEVAISGIGLAGRTDDELNVVPDLPASLGGLILPHDIPHEVLFHETAEDPLLRMCIQAGTVPTVDTIFRFLSYSFNCTAVPPPCNILAFLYIKRLKSLCTFTACNWRGLWIGSLVIAQKFFNDLALRTSRVASFFPGVTKQHLHALELKVFELLGFNAYISPSAYIQTHLNLRMLFQTVLHERQHGGHHRPLHPRSLLVRRTDKAGDNNTCRAKSADSVLGSDRSALFVLS